MKAEDEKKLDEVDASIDEAIHPDDMTQEEALEWLIELRERVETKINGLKTDLGVE